MSSAVEVAGFLKGVRLFAAFTDAELAALAPRLRSRTLRTGQVLFREGDSGDEMFVVRTGTMVISKAVTGRVEQVLARVTAGDFFGEMALFDRAPRSATIQAESEATLLVLDRDNLNILIEQNPRAAAAFFHALVRVFIERLRASGELVAEITRWGLEATGLDLDPR
ncbi:MAG: cyclic nucleotide-binding domain-containing protein [Candidatus Rokubacteria bacterium]|nr:cyclic nucleotide-binding domain-containing protein [Candidatus Rokubacteria bacterium]